MKEASCQCACANIRIHGQLLPNGAIPNVPPSERERLRFCQRLYSIQKQSISIQNANQIGAKTLSPVCTDLFCKTCGTPFRFFFGRGSLSYFGQLPVKNSRTQIIAHRKSQGSSLQPNYVISSESPPLQPLSPNMSSGNKKIPLSISKNIPNILVPLIMSDNSNSTNHQQLGTNISAGITNLNDGFGISNEEASEIMISNDDTDFDLMFSSKADPIVGSYKQHMFLPGDNIITNAISEYGPKSYYA